MLLREYYANTTRNYLLGGYRPAPSPPPHSALRSSRRRNPTVNLLFQHEAINAGMATLDAGSPDTCQVSAHH